jgi:hypothetical protein
LPNNVLLSVSSGKKRAAAIIPVKMEKNTIPIIIQQIVIKRPQTDFGTLSP